jgi:hypothetical protein
MVTTYTTHAAKIQNKRAYYAFFAAEERINEYD